MENIHKDLTVEAVDSKTASTNNLDEVDTMQNTNKVNTTHYNVVTINNDVVTNVNTTNDTNMIDLSLPEDMRNYESLTAEEKEGLIENLDELNRILQKDVKSLSLEELANYRDDFLLLKRLCREVYNISFEQREYYYYYYYYYYEELDSQICFNNINFKNIYNIFYGFIFRNYWHDSSVLDISLYIEDCRKKLEDMKVEKVELEEKYKMEFSDFNIEKLIKRKDEILNFLISAGYKNKTKMFYRRYFGYLINKAKDEDTKKMYEDLRDELVNILITIEHKTNLNGHIRRLNAGIRDFKKHLKEWDNILSENPNHFKELQERYSKSQEELHNIVKYYEDKFSQAWLVYQREIANRFDINEDTNIDEEVRDFILKLKNNNNFLGFSLFSGKLQSVCGYNQKNCDYICLCDYEPARYFDYDLKEYDYYTRPYYDNRYYKIVDNLDKYKLIIPKWKYFYNRAVRHEYADYDYDERYTIRFDSYIQSIILERSVLKKHQLV